MLRTRTTSAVIVAHGGVLMTILSAYGLPPERYDTALRVSFGMENTQRDIDELAEGLRACIRRFVTR